MAVIESQNSKVETTNMPGKQGCPENNLLKTLLFL